jgi:hypothetical protein
MALLDVGERGGGLHGTLGQRARRRQLVGLLAYAEQVEQRGLGHVRPAMAVEGAGVGVVPIRADE